MLMGNLTKKNNNLPVFPNTNPDRTETFAGKWTARVSKIFNQPDGSTIKLTRKINKDGSITEADRYMTGKSAMPKFFYGLNLKVTYRNWDFGLNGHGSAGTWVFNDFMSANSTASLDLNAGNLPNQATLVKKTGFTAPNSSQQWYSDYFIENASFFRLDDINLGYTFRAIGRWETDIRLACGVQNVFILNGYSGMDPEVISENGIDNTIWPRPRTYSLRLGVNF